MKSVFVCMYKDESGTRGKVVEAEIGKPMAITNDMTTIIPCLTKDKAKDLLNTITAAVKG